MFQVKKEIFHNFRDLLKVKTGVAPVAHLLTEVRIRLIYCNSQSYPHNYKLILLMLINDFGNKLLFQVVYLISDSHRQCCSMPSVN